MIFFLLSVLIRLSIITHFTCELYELLMHKMDQSSMNVVNYKNLIITIFNTFIFDWETTLYIYLLMYIPSMYISVEYYSSIYNVIKNNKLDHVLKNTIDFLKIIYIPIDKCIKFTSNLIISSLPKTLNNEKQQDEKIETMMDEDTSKLNMQLDNLLKSGIEMIIETKKGNPTPSQRNKFAKYMDDFKKIYNISNDTKKHK